MIRSKRLIFLGDKVLDSRILTEYFICDIACCHGACCKEGASGAPLSADEIVALEAELDQISTILSERSRMALKEGVAYRDSDGDWVTQLVNGSECAFAIEENGDYRCAIEVLNACGLVNASKPISCALYPIRVGYSGVQTLMKYDVWDICQAAPILGKREGVKIYQFLRRPLSRAFGEDFYNELDRVAQEIEASDVYCG